MQSISLYTFIAVSIVLMVSFISLSNSQPADEAKLRVRRKVSDSRTSWNKIQNCIKTRMGAAHTTNKDVRCAGREMHTVFQVRREQPCKNCDLYFFCVANANAVANCGGHHHAIEAAVAISQCEDFRTTADVDESINEASDFGRRGGNCASMYLCSSGCKFDVSASTCSAVCT